jgi:NAD(P)-dependent dehydrogenase (short-subunit alcohol dehydrogenase family)
MSTHLIQNKIALITGAGSGIGKATAELFAQNGALVIIADINETLAKEAAYGIVSKGLSADFIKLDVTDESSWINTYQFILSQYQQLHILVNNAGIAFGGSVTALSIHEWRRLMAVNLDGVFLGTKHAIPFMTQCQGGSIVNVSSAAGIVGSPAAAAYCASKGGVRMLTKAVALECAQAKNNIRVNSVHPGPVSTPMFENGPTWNDYVAQMGGVKAAWKAIAESTPLGRVAEAREIANAILFLASDLSSYMTGSELTIDGGFTAQ